MVDELRRFVSSKGWLYLKNIAKVSIGNMEPPWPIRTPEQMGQLARARLIARFVFRLFREVEKIAELPSNMSSADKLLHKSLSEHPIQYIETEITR